MEKIFSIKLMKQILDLSKSGNKQDFLKIIDTSDLFSQPIEKIDYDFLMCRDVAQLMHSFANLKVYEPKYWVYLQALFLNKNQSMNIIDFANCAWAFSKYSQVVHPEIWIQLEKGVLKHVYRLNPRELSTFAYSFAFKGIVSPNFWEKLKDCCFGHIHRMTTFDLTMAIWAFSKMNIRDRNLWNMLEFKLLNTVSSFNTNQICTTVYSLAKINEGRHETWFLLENWVINNIQKLSPRNIASIIWSFAKVQKGRPNFWDLLNNQVFDKMLDFDNLIDLVNSMWGLDHMNKLDENFFLKFEDYIYRKDVREKKINDQDLFNLSWILYNNKFHNGKIWAYLVRNFKKFLNKYEIDNNFVFKSHKCFYNFNRNIWESNGNYYYKLHLQRILISLNENGIIKNQDLLNIIEMTYYAIHMRLGDAEFWNLVNDVLKSMKRPLIKNINTKLLIKMLFVVANRLPNYLLEFEKNFIEDPKLFLEEAKKEQEFMLILLWSHLLAKKQGKIFLLIENIYKTIPITKEYMKKLFITFLSCKNDFKDYSKLYLADIVNEYVDKLQKDTYVQVKNEIFEEIFSIVHNKTSTATNSRQFIKFVEAELKEGIKTGVKYDNSEISGDDHIRITLKLLEDNFVHITNEKNSTELV